MGNCGYEKTMSLIEHHNKKKESLGEQDIIMKPSREISKNYIILKKINETNSMKTFLALNKEKEKIVLKYVSKNVFLTFEEKKRFLFEQKILYKLDHPHIMKILNIYQSEKRYFIEQEFCENGDFSSLLKSTPIFTLGELKEIAGQIILGISYLHERGITFGNLRAENIFLSENGSLKLKKENILAEKSILNETLKGTLSYLAPEYFSGSSISPKVDFWALGVLLYFLWFRDYPFDSVNPEELFRNISTRKIKGLDTKTIPEKFKLLLIDLLQVCPNQRIGNSLNDFKKHPFFKNLDWEGLSQKKQFTYLQSESSFSDEFESEVTDNDSIYFPEKREGLFNTNLCFNVSSIKQNEKLHMSFILHDKNKSILRRENKFDIKSNYNNF